MTGLNRKRSKIFGGALAFAVAAGIYYGISAGGQMEDIAKIELSPDMVTAVWTGGDARAIADEQELAGDPQSGTGGKPETSWQTDYGTYYRHENEAIVDLRAEHRLTELYLFGEGGNGKVRFEYGKPFDWQPLLSYDDPDASPHWSRYTLGEGEEGVRTRYLRITIHNGTDGSEPGDDEPPAKTFNEMALYGRALEKPEAIPEPKPPARTKMAKFIGMNGFIDDSAHVLMAGGTVREYHNWLWGEGDTNPDYPFPYPNNKNAWNPSYPGWDFDAYYRKLKELDITVFPAIQGKVVWNTNAKNMTTADSDPLVPSSYAPISDHLFQYAARYGKTKVDPSLLKVADNNEPLSGLDLIEYYEGGNEIDATWVERDELYTPFEYAARMSASYDGDQGRMKNADGAATFGVKSADPGAKFVLPGLADDKFRYTLDYIKSVKLWADAHRAADGPNGSFPGDVINLHFYAFGRTLGPEFKQGVSPERFGLKERIAPVVDFRDRYLPDKELWVSEFGYDVNQLSPISAPRIVNEAKGIDYSPEEVQAQWLVRTFLELAAAGIDRAQMFMSRDVNEEDATQFSSSGLVKKGEDKRPSWFYLITIKRLLGELAFGRSLEVDEAPVRAISFVDGAGKTRAYAVWSPTDNGTIVKNYSLQLPEWASQATLVRLKHECMDGESEPLAIGADGRVALEVGENPVLVMLRE